MSHLYAAIIFSRSVERQQSGKSKESGSGREGPRQRGRCRASVTYGGAATLIVFVPDFWVAKRKSNPIAGAGGTASNNPINPNKAPNANSANISQTGLSLTRRPIMRGA